MGISKFLASRNIELIQRILEGKNKTTLTHNLNEGYVHCMDTISDKNVYERLEDFLYGDYAYVQMFLDDYYPEIIDEIYNILNNVQTEKITTEICKELIRDELGVENLKRVSKSKKNNYVNRVFVDEDGCEYIVISNTNNTAIIDMIVED